jgi:hypothetical protein
VNLNPLNYIPSGVSSVVARKTLVVQKHSPIILFTSGVVGTVTATVLACRATMNLETVLSSAQDKLDVVNAAEPTDTLTQQQIDKAKVTVKVQTALQIGKLYAPAVILGVASIGALTGSHYIMSKRQAGLFAAYASLDKAYKEYQDRVREELGVDREEQLRHGAIVEKVKGEDGKTVKVTRKDPNAHSPYARLFSEETSKEWVPTPEYNVLTLQAKQAYCTQQLNANGHLFLNDVYKMLGLAPTREGQLVGWVKGKGDDFVDFGIFKNNSDRIHDFMYGVEGAVWLDFNVAGMILDLI